MRLLSPLGKSLEWVTGFLGAVPSAAALGNLLTAFLVSKDFVKDVRAIMGPKAPIAEGLLSRIVVDGKQCTVNRSAKQFYKLPADPRWRRTSTTACSASSCSCAT